MESVENIFHHNYSPLCNYATKIVDNSAIAEDIVQDLFVQLLEKNKFEDIINFERYLLRATKFKCLNYLKSKEINTTIPFDRIAHETAASLSDLKDEDIEQLLHYFAAKLPRKTRAVFLLSRESKLTYKEISEELNISQKTVEAQMSRALRMMREVLKEQEFLVFLLLFSN